MTLLVLSISVPQISSHSVDIVGTELPKKLFDLWPKILSYAISFLILAIYWSGHHRQFHYIKHSDRVLVWINNMRLLYEKNSVAMLWIKAIQQKFGEDHADSELKRWKTECVIMIVFPIILSPFTYDLPSNGPVTDTTEKNQVGE